MRAQHQSCVCLVHAGVGFRRMYASSLPWHAGCVERSPMKSECQERRGSIQSRSEFADWSESRSVERYPLSRRLRVKRTSIRSALILSLAAACASVGTVGCTHQGADEVEPQEDVGSIRLSLNTGGVVVDSIHYSITGGGLAAPRSGDFSVAGPGRTFTQLLSGIPAGTGYTLNLTATAVDGVTTGAGSATFSIVARQQTAVAVHLVFHGQSANTGSLLINGDINIAPRVDSVTAL